MTLFRPLFLALLFVEPLWAGNPIIPGDYFAEPNPHVWADGTLYVYCTHDQTKAAPNGDNYHIVSTTDMVHWKDNGVALTVRRLGTPRSRALYACDCLFAQGLYHLYASTDDKKIVELSSPNPTGPFGDPHLIAGINAIDPAVFLDDDGQAYLYWGEKDEVRAAKLKPNLYEIDSTTDVQPLTAVVDGFQEGSALVKRGKIYYYIFTSTVRNSTPTCLAYATSDHPLGPFKYGGVIIDNVGCDPSVWDNHGRIVQFQNQWYVFYHRSTGGDRYERQFCVEPITFNPDGTIPEVPMTSKGVEPPLDPSELLATCICQLSGNARLVWDKGTKQFILSQIQSDDAAYFRGLLPGQPGQQIEMTYSGASTAGDFVEVHEDNPQGEVIATISLAPGGWQTTKTPFTLPFKGGNLCLVFLVADVSSLKVKSIGFKS